MNRKIAVLILLASMLLVLSGCSSQDISNANTATKINPTSAPTTATSVPRSAVTVKPQPTATNTNSSSSSAKSVQTVSFTNSYGTSSTVCAISNCSRLIASSGDTNCCTIHSNNCKECGKYIDSDATWCMSCIEKAASKAAEPPKSTSNYSTKKTTACGHDSCATNGPFYCMGKNNTCPNTTSCAYDMYCSSCD